MTDLPKRELRRTGLQVTMLGYGAMELRGAPRARPTTDQEAETILNAVTSRIRLATLPSCWRST